MSFEGGFHGGRQGDANGDQHHMVMIALPAAK